MIRNALIVCMLIVIIFALYSMRAKNEFVLTSPSFQHNAFMPLEYAQKGFTDVARNSSPDLHWSNAPKNTKSFALISEDPDAVGGPFVHWVVYDIPASMNVLPINASYNNLIGTQGKNDEGANEYYGPFPPAGTGTHRYVFTLYALDTILGLEPGLTAHELKTALNGHVLAQAELIGLCTAPERKVPKAVQSLPKPTGIVGTTSYHLTDLTRKEVHVQNSQDVRELMLQIWYPAMPVETVTAKAVTAKVVPEKSVRNWYIDPNSSEIIKKELQDHFKVTPEELSFLDTVETHALLNAKISGYHPSYPVLIFSPGFGAQVNFYTSLLEELASHGYIVAAISYPYITSPVNFGGRIINQKSLKMLQQLWGLSSEEEAAIREQEIWVNDISFVIKQLELLNKNDPHNILIDRMNLDEIGMFGHSFGGGASLAACSSIKECKAVATLDGRPRGAAITYDLSVPTLLVGSSLHPQEKKEQFYQLWDAMKGPSYYAVVKDALHGSFTDLFLFIPWKGEPALKLEPVRAIAMTRDLLVNFFNRYLKGEIGIIEGIMKNYPEIALSINRQAMAEQKPLTEDERRAISDYMKSHYD